jgi:aspartokinase
VKDFEYYQEPEVEYFTHADRRDMAAKLQQQIDNERMTLQERQEAVKAAQKEVEAAANAQNALYLARGEELQAEFWADAREELGYNKLFNEEGCKLLESAAWDKDRGYAFEDTFAGLKVQLDFVKQIIASRLPVEEKGET